MLRPSYIHTLVFHVVIKWHLYIGMGSWDFERLYGETTFVSFAHGTRSKHHAAGGYTENWTAWLPGDLGHVQNKDTVLSMNTLRPRWNRRQFAGDIFNLIFYNEDIWIAIKISRKFVVKGPINNIPALVYIMAWRRPGNKPIYEPIS